MDEVVDANGEKEKDEGEGRYVRDCLGMASTSHPKIPPDASERALGACPANPSCDFNQRFLIAKTSPFLIMCPHSLISSTYICALN